MFQSQPTLGVEELYYIRCPSCGTLLAGKVESEYKELISIAKKEIEQKIPDILYPDEKYKIYESELERYLVLIFEKIGIKRICCKMRLMNPLQIVTGSQVQPPGNTAIDRQTIRDKKDGYFRSPTIISLSTFSKVPGKGGLNMMSVMGNEEYEQNKEQWADFNEKVNKEFLSGASKYQRIMNSEIIKKTPFDFKLINVPQTKSIGAVPIKDNYLSRLTDIEFMGENDDMEISSEPQEELISSIEQLSIEERLNPFNTNLDDIQNMDLTYPGGLTYINDT